MWNNLKQKGPPWSSANLILWRKISRVREFQWQPQNVCYQLVSTITNSYPSPCQFIFGEGNTKKLLLKSRWKETFLNEQRVIMHDRRTKLNHFIYCTENQYEVSIQRMSSMLRTRGFTAWRIKGLGPQAWMCQYMCEYQNALGAWKQIIPLAALKC